jgi:hypothetical protein
MGGETDLKTLIANLMPLMRPETYVFCTLQNGRYGDKLETRPLASFLESEGLTLVITQAQADREGLSYQGLFRCITLEVHSSLEAVGLTAVVASALAAENISANVMAAYFHDHVFVPFPDGEAALDIIKAI